MPDLPNKKDMGAFGGKSTGRGFENREKAETPAENKAVKPGPNKAEQPGENKAGG